MDSLGFIGYLASTLGFLILAVILKTSWQGRIQGAILIVAALINAVWSAILAYTDYVHQANAPLIAIIELVRVGGWLAFLYVLILFNEQKHNKFKLIRIVAFGIFGIIFLELVFFSLALLVNIPIPVRIVFDAYIISLIVFCVIGLVLVEQLFRNSQQERRWAIKFLCLGIGGLFAFDFYLFTEAMLLKQVDTNIWDARGFINAMVVPLIAVSAARNPQWSLDVFVSRKFVFHTTAIMAAGIYLLSMAAVGFYIKLYGGSWGSVAQLAFLFGALITLVLLFFSGQMRAQFRVFLSKHFFNYRYDYREEWLKFINTLSDQKRDKHTREQVIQAIADIVDSTGGMLWLLREPELYRMMSNLNMVTTGTGFDESSGSLTHFLESRQWVVELDEYHQDRDLYRGLELPNWLVLLPQAWLIVPLLQNTQLFGFIVLAKSRAKIKINWENRDLLTTTGRQATSYLALLDASESLLDARQFDAFNRLSAYVVHDLKNVAAQLALVVKNAERHKENPEFVEDAINTVDNSVKKMNRMLAQLRKNPTSIIRHASRINLFAVVEQVTNDRKIDLPEPQLQKGNEHLFVIADKDRLLSVMEHIIQNAQDATEETGYVNVIITVDGKFALVEIKDNGHGMDEKFIQERLFRPFDTTKGNAGMGIGVYESKEFISSIGGRLDVVSETRKGTSFFIRLPLDEEPLDKKPLDKKPLDDESLDKKSLDQKPLDQKQVDEKQIRDENKK